ncbi:hypothetical protein [Streptomyces himastatinicus]|uniref:hypothetical protein n=1 Tax=Streptomyces himastatinicus TaxID=998084 RepID=UPI0012B69D3F|nr:hypothetical protein [Streptomyces himastatinicus]
MKPQDAQTVHSGHGVPSETTLWRINAWLEANGIDPCLVLAERPIYVLAVANGTIQGGLPWLIDVIVFHQYYEHPDGTRELNFITHEAVSFQRTVPLQVPFPADPTTDDEGAIDGEADQQAEEEAAEVQVRAARQAGVPRGHEGQSEERAGQGEPTRIEGAAEEGTRRGDEAVPEPEEVRRKPEEEVAP